jgi:Family of unknown function (DUF6433)
MSNTIGLAEFLGRVEKLRLKSEKVAALRHNNSLELGMILRGIYDPRIKWMLSEGVPNFTPNDLPDQEHMFLREIKKVIYFVEGAHNANLTPDKREAMFVEMLEKISKQDASLLLAMKDKKMPYKTITRNVVNEAFPGLLPLEDENENLNVENQA